MKEKSNKKAEGRPKQKGKKFKWERREREGPNLKERKSRWEEG